MNEGAARGELLWLKESSCHHSLWLLHRHRLFWSLMAWRILPSVDQTHWERDNNFLLKQLLPQKSLMSPCRNFSIKSNIFNFETLQHKLWSGGKKKTDRWNKYRIPHFTWFPKCFLVEDLPEIHNWQTQSQKLKSLKFYKPIKNIIVTVTPNLKSKYFIKIAQFSQLLQKMFSGALLPLN